MELTLKGRIKNSMIYALADFSVKSVNLILTPYYISILDKSEFGLLGILLSIVSFGNVLFGMGFQSGFTRFYNFKKEIFNSIFSSSLFFLTLIGLFGTVLLAFIISGINLVDHPAVGFWEILLLICAAAIIGIFIQNGVALYKVQEKPIKSGLLGLSYSW